MVTDIDWIRDPGRSIGNWMPCPVRVYDNAHRDDAARWLASLATADQPSIAQTVKAYVGGTVGAAISIAKLLLVKRFGGNRLVSWQKTGDAIARRLEIQDDSQCRTNAAHVVEAKEPYAPAEPAWVDRCCLLGKYPGIGAADFDLGPKACGTS